LRLIIVFIASLYEIMVSKTILFEGPLEVILLLVYAIVQLGYY